MKRRFVIQPRYIIAITIGIAVVMFGSAFLELQQSRAELLHLLQEHSITLSETIERSSATIILSSDYIEGELSKRLFNNAFFIAQRDSPNTVTVRELQKICSENDIFRINVFDRKGERTVTSHPPQGYGRGLGERTRPWSFFEPILRGDTDRTVIGFQQARFSNEQRYAVAVRRTNPAGGVIVLSFNAEQLTEFRKSIGIGRLIADVGNNSEVEYVALQDNDGIIVATDSVDELTTIENDSPLSIALQTDSVITRQSTFHGREVYEVIRSLNLNGEVAGVLRIGLSMDEIRAVEDRMQRRLLMMTLVFIAIGSVVMTAIIAGQNVAILSRKYERVRALTENILYTMQDMVIAFDGGNRLSLFNQRAEEFFSVQAKELIGKRISELPGTVRKTIEAVLTVQETDGECIIADSTGKDRVLSVTVSKSVQEGDKTESTTLLIKDRTESRKMEREIQRKEKLTAMGELASGVAHEIRNPLNAISMIAQRFEKEFEPTKEVKEYRELTSVLKKETARVNGIIRQFLTFARPPKINKGEIPAKEFLSHVITLTSPLASAKGINLLSSADDITIAVDAEQMTQALLNLLQNAIEAVPPTGTVAVVVQQQGEDVEISVTDNGVGIPEAHMEKIFNLYYTTKGEGTGVGLAVTQQIVSQHGGTIEVLSTPGNGSTFILRIPRSS